jgi:hypothetical protein
LRHDSLTSLQAGLQVGPVTASQTEAHNRYQAITDLEHPNQPSPLGDLRELCCVHQVQRFATILNMACQPQTLFIAEWNRPPPTHLRALSGSHSYVSTRYDPSLRAGHDMLHVQPGQDKQLQVSTAHWEHSKADAKQGTARPCASNSAVAHIALFCLDVIG